DRHHLINHYRCEDKKNKTQITQLMMSNNILLEKKLFESSLEKEQATFFLWAKDIENDELVKVVYLVTDIVNLRYCIEDYVNTLERAELPLDELKSTRLSVIKRLNNYLAEQTELTDAVKKQIANYVTLIREMQPALCEKQFLNIMSPPPLMDTIWPIVTSMGITFFNLIQAPVEDPSSLDSTTTKSSTQIPSPNYYPKSSLDKA
ncbi:MAG: helical bundle domain-containing protein, partial [bacterium]|nr:helical bundle domain-containing protein [bacterium]